MKGIFKRHMGLTIILLLTFILMIILLIIFGRMLLTNGDSYGNRLNGIPELKSSVNKEIEEKIKENDIVVDTSIRIQGKIIYLNITYKEGTKVNDAKNIANKTIDMYEEDIVSNYDLCYFLVENIDNSDTEEEKTGFLVAGTKHPDNETISWTKN